MRCAAIAVACGLCLASSTAWAQGLASKYLCDKGLESDPEVLYYLPFDDQAATQTWSKGIAGYGWTADSAHRVCGEGALEIQQTKGTHNPEEVHPALTPTDVAYVRWYRKWESGYDFVQHKMPGVYACWAQGCGSAGEVPTGYDKYSCKLFVNYDREPHFYAYNPEQSTVWGDDLAQNLVSPEITVVADRWYCFEMMIKANSPPNHDGELKLWIDGQLVGHHKDMRFRDTTDLKINVFTYSAYVGGSWTSERDQKLWDDQIVVAKSYIGPAVLSAPEGGLGGAAGAGAGGTGGKDAGTVTGGQAGALADVWSEGQGASAGQTADAAPPDASAGSGAEDSGCGCRSTRPVSVSGWLLIAMVGALGRRWRRAKASASTPL